MKTTMKHCTSLLLLAIAAIATLASCSENDVSDGDRLPDGKYPMTFSATQLEVTPQTRVSDYDDPADNKHKSRFNDGDRIKITVGYAANQASTFCTLNADGTVASYDSQLYWQSKGEHTINAWYSNITGQSTVTSNTVSLADQSSGLAYVLKVEQKVTYSTQPVSLEFSHQLAKVRVKLVAGTTITDLTDATVTIKNQYTGCSIDKGTVTGTGNGTIAMHKATYGGETYYEANIVPGTKLAADCFEITAENRKTTVTTPIITTTKAGEMYSFTVTVNTKEIDITSTADADNPYLYTVSKNASVILDGKGIPLNNKHIIINDGAHVMLKNVKMTAPAEVHVIEVKGNATITLSGENEIIGDNTGAKCPIAITQAGATLTINGTVNDKLTLTANSTFAVGLGAANNANLVINGGTIIATAVDGGAAIGGSLYLECGNITINGGDITAKGGKNSAAIGAGIWIDDEPIGKCGNITINGGKINAIGNSDSDSESGIGIGSGYRSTCGTITIAGGNIIATAGSGKYGGAGIGSADFGTCGAITITGGTIEATGKRGTTLDLGTYDSGAGIGAGAAGNCGNISISGPDTFVTATGGEGSDDIGYGYSPAPDQPSPSGKVEIADEANVIATHGKVHGYPNGLN